MQIVLFRACSVHPLAGLSGVVILRIINSLTLLLIGNPVTDTMEPCSHVIINEDSEDINIDEQSNTASNEVCAIHRQMRNLISLQLKFQKKIYNDEL